MPDLGMIVFGITIEFKHTDVAQWLVLMRPDLGHAALMPRHIATGGISAAELSVAQAVEPDVTLPVPVKHNPNTRTKCFLKRLNILGNIFSFCEPTQAGHFLLADYLRRSKQGPFTLHAIQQVLLSGTEVVTITEKHLATIVQQEISRHQLSHDTTGSKLVTRRDIFI